SLMNPTTAQQDALAAVASFKSAQGWSVIEDFISLLQIPNVTGQVAGLKLNAAELVDRFEQRGARMEIVEIPDASPVVIGELRPANPSATLGVYVHSDGQPVDATAWTAPPFAAPLVTTSWHEGGVAV